MSWNNTYHIRVRGNVLGPFRREQILKLIERGQLTRMHEVSCDGSDWQPAGQYEELFPITSPAQESDIERLSRWYYHTAEGEKGPASVWELKQLIAQGVLGPENEVWREGMAGWQPLRSTELAAYLSLSRDASEGVGDSSSFTQEDRIELHAPVHPLSDIRSRSLLIAGLWALVAAFSLVCAMLFILAGRLPDSRSIVVIIAIINAIYCAAALFLVRDAMFIAAPPHSTDMNDAIFARLRTFWFWSAPVSLLVVMLYVVLLILGLSSDAHATP